MLKRSLLLSLALATPVMAQTPRVVTDIAPIGGLVSMVMGDLGASDVLIAPNASPHTYALRPSDAAALEQADLVIWMGEALTPWLADSIAVLAKDAQIIELLDAPDTHILEFSAAKDPHDDHDDHAKTDHDHGHDDHDHSGIDPHAWLDPNNGAVWVDLIAQKLSEMDPDNAAQYALNAQKAQADIAAITADIAAKLEPHHDVPFLVFHDAYQYFETRFGLDSSGAVSLGDGAALAPTDLQDLREMVSNEGVTCAFTEPQFDPRVIETVFAGLLKPVELDPLGADAGGYLEMMKNLGTAFERCLTQTP